MLVPVAPQNRLSGVGETGVTVTCMLFLSFLLLILFIYFLFYIFLLGSFVCLFVCFLKQRSHHVVAGLKFTLTQAGFNQIHGESLALASQVLALQE